MGLVWNLVLSLSLIRAPTLHPDVYGVSILVGSANLPCIYFAKPIKPWRLEFSCFKTMRDFWQLNAHHMMNRVYNLTRKPKVQHEKKN